MSTNTNAAQRYKNFPDTAAQLTELLSERWSLLGIGLDFS